MWLLWAPVSVWLFWWAAGGFGEGVLCLLPSTRRVNKHDEHLGPFLWPSPLWCWWWGGVRLHAINKNQMNKNVHTEKQAGEH